MFAPCTPRCRLPVVIGLGICLTATAALADSHRVLPEGKLPNDARLGPLVNLNGYFPFTPSKSAKEWDARAKDLRRQLLVALGLWPMPAKTPANAVVHTPIDRDTYTVEHVYLESYPGHFVTGNLYRPKNAKGKCPGVLCPHGHWPNGRFFDQSAKMPEQIVMGAERFEIGGSSPLQSRCVQLARMGCVVFHYDMVGYADSIQLQHRPGPRESMSTLESWGYGSPQADLRMQNMMGLQTYNSIRALDWFCELPDVDPTRIGVTGASGGGTQTFILGAVDPRPTVIFPAVMVSTAMQGGCTCENAPYLRVRTGNIEIAALFAPKPLGMSGADDWTKEIMTKGLPELRQQWKLLGAADKVMAKALVQFPHNYNYVSRAVMYSWFNKHLKLGLKEPIVEEDYRPLSIAEMSVWDKDHPKPPSGDDYERRHLAAVTRAQEKQLAELSAQAPEKYRELVGGAADVLLGRDYADVGPVETEKSDETDRGDYLEFGLLLRATRYNEELPALFLLPKKWSKQVVIWADEQGKQALFDTSGDLRAEVQKLLKAGHCVVGVDLIGQGEFTADGQPLKHARLNEGGSGTAKWTTNSCYTHGYNDSLFAQRVHDLLSVVSFARHHERKPEQVHLIGSGAAGAWVAAARAQAGKMVDRAAIDLRGFRFEKVNAIDDPNFLPGAVKYGDVEGLLSLSAPHALWLTSDDSQPSKLVTAAYTAAGATDRLTINGQPEKQRLAEALDWLTGN